jgi:RNA recognition motif-containing protein
MSISLFVGNVPFDALESELMAVFTLAGEVESVALIRNDRQLDRRRAFGFVKMPDEAALKAVSSLNGFSLRGRALVVKPAVPRPKAPRLPGYRRPAQAARSLEADLMVSACELDQD